MIQTGTMISSRYEIEEKIGTGGMSIVYKAMDTRLSRIVAVKVLKDEFCYDDEFVRKFKVEAQAAASLSHSSIVNIYDVGNDGKIYYIVMEYLDGMTLKEYIATHGKLTNSDTMRISAAMSSALECAHNNHIIHRDIKPQNILVMKDGRVKVTDFGIARIATGATIPATDMASGSVHYIPPEQAKSGYSNEQSDIYSLGITMFEMITGQVPFEADSAVSVALKQIHDDLPDIRELNGDVDQHLERIIRKATMKKVELRYASAGELLDDLRKANTYPEQEFVEVDRFNSSAETMIMSESQMRQIWDETEVMEDLNPKLERGVVIGGVVAAVIAVALIVTFIFNQFREDIVPVQITVPTIEGMNFEEAQTLLREEGLTLVVADYQYNNDLAKDIILAQSPETGVVVGERTEVTVVVSLGQQLFKVPQVLNTQFSVAEELLRGSQMVPVRNEAYDDFAAVGTVIDQFPVAGTEMVAGSKVTITVSLGKEEKYVKVPDVRGLTLEEAQSELRLVGLTPGDNTTESHNEVVEAGKVIAMTVKPGQSVKEGYVVDVTVSLGKEIVDVVKLIRVNDILGLEETALMKVVLVRAGSEEEEELFNRLVSHSDFNPVVAIEASGQGEAIYKVYLDGNLEYQDKILFTETEEPVE